MIAQYESEPRDTRLDSPRQYALGLSHKHLPEMTAVCGLSHKPIFNPIVADYYSGMCVTVPLYTDLMTKKMSVEQIKTYFAEYYARRNFIKVIEKETLDGGFLSANDPVRHKPHGNIRGRQRRTDLARVPIRQSRQGRFRRGGAVYESDAGAGRNHVFDRISCKNFRGGHYEKNQRRRVRARGLSCQRRALRHPEK